MTAREVIRHLNNVPPETEVLIELTQIDSIGEIRYWPDLKNIIITSKSDSSERQLREEENEDI